MTCAWTSAGPRRCAAILDGFLADGVAFERIGAVAFRDVQAGETAHEARDAAAGGLHFDGNGDGVAVVFDHVEQRQFFRAGDVERFPELAFAGGAIASRNVDDFVAVVIDVLAERSLLGLRERFLTMLVVKGGFRSADRLHELRAGAGRTADDVPLVVAPVRRHLAAAGSGIILGADGLQQHLERRDAEHQAEGAVAVIRDKPNRRRDEEATPLRP